MLMDSDNASVKFKSIVAAYQEKVRNTCYRYVYNLDDANEIAQEVFIQLYRTMENFRGESDIGTWIFRIAVNKSLDFIRRKNRKKRFATLTSLFGSDGEAKDIEDPTGNNPQNDLENKERAIVLQKALEQIPEKQRSVIILGKYQGLSNNEIAQILSLSLSAVEALMNRAKNNLRKRLTYYFIKSS